MTSRILTTYPVDSAEFEELVELPGSYLAQGKECNFELLFLIGMITATLVVILLTKEW